MKKNTNTNTNTNVTPATKNTPVTVSTFADALRALYARNSGAGLTGKERTEALHGGDTALAYRVAVYAARKACAAYVLAMATDGKTATGARNTFYNALRAVYAFSGARVNAADGVQLPALFGVRMDVVRRVKTAADVVTADGASVDTYEKRRTCVVPSDAIWFKALETAAGARLAGVDIAGRAAGVYADIAAAPATAAKSAPRPTEGKAPVHAVEARPATKGAPRKKQSRAVEAAPTGEKVMEARRDEFAAQDATIAASNAARPADVVK